jgi:hypothetical protein
MARDRSDLEHKTVNIFQKTKLVKAMVQMQVALGRYPFACVSLT